ncbi:MAG TPA: glycosyltransferase [Nitrospiria bacterium]
MINRLPLLHIVFLAALILCLNPLPGFSAESEADTAGSAQTAESISLDEARQLVEDDRLPEAHEQLLKLLEEDPSDNAVRLELARLLVRMDELDEAISHYQNFMDREPDNRETRVEFAWTLMRAEQFKRSVAQYELLLEMDPNSVRYRLGRALALYGSGDLVGALKEYEKVLEIEPDNVEAKIGIYELEGLVVKPFHRLAGFFFVFLLTIVLISVVVVAYLWARPARLKDNKEGKGRFRELYIHAVAVISLAVASYYIVWRLTSTMNWDAWWFSVPIVAAEIWGIIVAFLFFFMVWNPLQRKAPPPLPGRSVDVFIPTLNEDPKILRKTILGCLNMSYPHETYVLDDGNRPEVASLARELGCKYIAREKNINAKAGNLNNALRQTSGEFIVTLDADHVPLPHFLDRLMGYFADEKVAFVQTPQDFYNIDSFQHRLDKKNRRMWTEQSLFFSVIQPGKDYWNSAFYCGSCGILRREALDSIGGFAEGTVTEDIHTSILLHAKGHRSVYHNESLAYGLAPGTTKPFLVQRLRWGQGAMQVLVSDNPLWIRGLTLPQRLSYLTSMTTYFDGYQKVVFYLAPLVYFATGILPILAFNVVFLMHFIPYFALFVLSFELMSRGYGSTFRTEQYNMAKFATFIRTLGGIFKTEKHKFKTTPKSKLHQTGYSILAPQLIVLGVNVVGVFIGSYRYFFRGELVTMAFYGNLVWAAFNISLAVAIIHFSRRKVQIRGSHRFLYLVPSSFSLPSKSSKETRVGLVLDCHEEGASLITSAPLPMDSPVDLLMTVGPREIETKGVVVASQEMSGRRNKLFRHGIRFTQIDEGDRNYLIQYSFEFLVPRLMQSYRQTTTVFDRLDRYVRKEKRKEKRWVLSLPITIQSLSDEVTGKIQGVTYDIGEGGLSVMSLEELPLSHPIEFVVSLTDRPIRGKGEILRGERLLSGGARMYRYIIKYKTESHADISPLKELNSLLHMVKTH